MIRSIQAGKVWFGLVLIHLASSLFAFIVNGIPGGFIFISVISWIFICYCCRAGARDFYDGFPGESVVSDHGKSRGLKGGVKGIGSMSPLARGIAGLVILGLVAVVQMAESEYRIEFMVNMIRLAYAAFLFSQARVLPEIYCGIRRPKRPGSLLLMIPTAFLLYIAAGYFNALSLLFFRNQLADAITVNSGSLAACLIALAFAPALTEEIFFRGLIFRDLGGNLKAVILSSVCFALLHMNFNQMCYAFAAGIVFALIVRKTGNLLCSVLVHFLFNSVTVVFRLLEGHRAVNKLVNIRIGGYAPFLGILQNDAGKIMWNAVVSGLVITLVCLFLIKLLVDMFQLRNSESEKTESIDKRDEEESERKGRKPDLYLAAGCLICILIAFVLE